LPLRPGVAQRTEKAFQHELPQPSSAATTSFVQQAYWDSLKKGLLAAEQRALDLQRMEAAYLDRNKRDYEITKHVSVSQLDPVALIELKELGKCSISIPEVLFDLDFPGHYYRRLKSVALSIPCVAGPYVGVNCKLTLTRHAYRKDAGIRSGEKYEADPFVSPPDNRFVSGDVPQDVVMSIAQNDTGLFETNLRDERYRAGAISEWKIELPDSFRAFDYGTISDVILHLRFTARDGGPDLKRAAGDQLTTALNDIAGTGGKKGLSRVFSLRHEFASEWYRFVNPTASVGDLTMAVPLSKDRFPAIFRDPRVKLTLSSLQVLAALKPEYLADHPVETTTPGAEHEPIKLSLKAGNVPSSSSMVLTRAERFLEGEVTATGEPRTWTLAGWLEEDPATGVHSRLDPHALEDILLVCHYSVSETPMTQ
jgi:Tc toxin complex TcA C-terminal TcB-binding domain